MWGSVTGKESSVPYSDLEPKVRFTPAERRKNIYEIKDKRKYSSIVSHCESVAILTNKTYLLSAEEGFILKSESLSEFVSRELFAPFGEHESFRDEPAPPGGTAFLVGDRYILTAGHCVCIPQKELFPGQDSETLDLARIRNKRVVFGFQKNHPAQSEFRFQEKDIYKIKKVVAHRFTAKKDWDRNNEKDWALIKLDRPVEGRSPLRLDFNSRIHLNTDLYVLGHPSGLPLKLTEGAKVKAIRNQCFYADVDASQGNSGSPVLIADKVCGIEVRGPADDYHVTANYCNTGRTRAQVRQVYGSGNCDIQKINQIRFVQHYLLAKSGDLDAHYQVALDYNFGEGGVKVDFSKAVKWMQKASDRGHAQAAIDLRILPEFNASRVLKLGRIGLSV